MCPTGIEACLGGRGGCLRDCDWLLQRYHQDIISELKFIAVASRIEQQTLDSQGPQPVPEIQRCLIWEPYIEGLSVVVVDQIFLESQNKVP